MAYLNRQHYDQFDKYIITVKLLILHFKKVSCLKIYVDCEILDS